MLSLARPFMAHVCRPGSPRLGLCANICLVVRSAHATVPTLSSDPSWTHWRVLAIDAATVRLGKTLVNTWIGAPLFDVV